MAVEIMNELELRERVRTVAESHLNRRESDGSHRPIIDSYNRIRPLPRGYALSYSDPWCAAFVSAVGAEAGAESVVYPECSCPEMLRKYIASGRTAAKDADVQVGDIVVYGEQEAGHVGIITGVSGNILHTVEGNLGDSVAARSISKNDGRIMCFCLPDYGALVPGGGQSAEKPAENRFTPRPLRYLRQGAQGEDVRSMQALLMLRGFSVGADGADGDFGRNTAAALREFQQAQGIEKDGVFGAESLSRLWEVSA